MIGDSTILRYGVLGGALVLSAMGCVGTETRLAEQSLYDRLGGNTAISAVVDQFVANVAGDSRINGRLPRRIYPG